MKKREILLSMELSNIIQCVHMIAEMSILKMPRRKDYPGMKMKKLSLIEGRKVDERKNQEIRFGYGSR
jgi:hypothetical protein